MAKTKTSNFSATAENTEDNSLNLKETIFRLAENISNQPLGFIEGFLMKGAIDKAFNEMLEALALHEIKYRELYREAGFNSFSDYCESRGIPKSEGYEWAKHVETAGPENFPVLAEKVGLNHRFFRAFALIPQEIQQAVIKGDTLEVDGKAYDFSGSGDAVKNLVIGLVKHSEKVKSEAQERISALQAQMKNDARRIKTLEMQLPKADDDSWASEPISSIEKSLIEFMNHMNYFCFSPELVGKGKVAGNIKAKVEGLYQTGYRAFLEFIDKWEDYTGHPAKGKK
jgi:hypothetical protein